jgi:hypothetical protein
LAHGLAGFLAGSLRAEPLVKAIPWVRSKPLFTAQTSAAPTLGFHAKLVAWLASLRYRGKSPETNPKGLLWGRSIPLVFGPDFHLASIQLCRPHIAGAELRDLWHRPQNQPGNP